MEYLQVKTPFIEKWEKESLNVQTTAENGQLFNNNMLEYSKLVDFNSVQSNLSYVPPVYWSSKNIVHKEIVKDHTPNVTKKRKAIDVQEDEHEIFNDVVRKELHNAVEKKNEEIKLTIS